jgi:hypothetical protein
MRLKSLGKGRLIGGVAGIIVALPFALYLGVLGATFAGSWGEYFAGPLGIVIGLVLGLLLVAASTLILGALVGGSLGFLLEHTLRNIKKPS